MSTTASSTEPSWKHYTAPEFVDVAGINVAYRRSGQGERLLYLHSDGLTRVWLPFFEELAAEIDLVAPEHPGYGDTAITDDVQSFEDLVLHYDALMRALDLDPVHLVGQGLGGWLAADLAVTYPTRFKSLTLVTPDGLRLADVSSVDHFRCTPDERLALQFNGRQESYREFVEQEGEPEDMIRALVQNSTTGRLAWNPRYDFRLDRRLRRVKAPTLVISAEDDRWVPNAMAARYAELIPSAELSAVVGGDIGPSGHLLHVEQPHATSQLIARHVAAHA